MTLKELASIGQPPLDKPDVRSKVVVIFDFCSSTAILEDLLRTENIARWQKVIGEVKRFMWSLSEKIPFEPYKFIGDGWILLFDDGVVDGRNLLLLMHAIQVQYEDLLRKEVEPVLTSMPSTIGVTFGIDVGTLVRLIINGNAEYVGRAINVAARLQAAIKGLDGKAGGTALFSANSFTKLAIPGAHDPVEVPLSNVSGGDKFRARRVRLDAVTPSL